MLKCLGYLNPKMEYWYKMPNKDALLSLSNDNDVLRFIKYVDRYKLMQLYKVHPIDKPKPLGDNEVTEETFDPLFCDVDPETSEVPNVTEPSEVPNVTEPSEVPNVTEPREVPNGPEPSEIPNDAEHRDGGDESEDSDFDVELEDMIEDVEVDMDDFRKYIDENVEWVGRNEVPVEDTQPVDTEVFEDLDLEDFDSASDPDDIECNRTISRTDFDCRDDLELTRNSNFTFISDRQKGFIPALQEMFPAAEHRFCLKHIYDNMKLSWRGQQYKELLWKSATSPTVQLFERNMEELRMINKDVYDWLKKIPPHHWSRSHFSGRPHCDVLLNNMCEVLNRQLLDGRDKPIITCLEFIRQYLMKRIVAVQKVINKSNGPLTPTAVKIFNNIKKEAAQITVLWNEGELYQATGPNVACIWDMATNGQEPGIPEHVEEVTKSNNINTTRLSHSYRLTTKEKKKSAAELFDGMVKNGKLSRAGKSVTYNKCGQVGHRSRSCKGQRGPQASQASTSASSQASQASVTPSAPTVSQSQTFVRPTPHSIRQTAPFLRPTAPFVTPRFTKTSAKRISPIKKTAGANGKGKNVQGNALQTTVNEICF
ncbi:hypothetical protein Tco_0039908 [Tanacetum coccineum]